MLKGGDCMRFLSLMTAFLYLMFFVAFVYLFYLVIKALKKYNASESIRKEKEENQKHLAMF